jgi:hypothetical protein
VARYQVQAPDGHTYEIEAPDSVTHEQLDAMSREVAGYAKDYPVKLGPKPADAPAPPAPGVGEQLLENTKNDLAGIAQGAAALPDMVATAAGKVASIVPTAIGYGLDALGYTGAADTAHKVAHGLASPYQIGDAVETVAPTPDTRSGKVNRFIGQMVGGAVTMPSSAVENVVARFAGEVPKGFVPASKAVEKVAPSIVGDAKEAGVPVMTSDVLPPRTFVGKSAQAVGERIPITGTGGAREAQQAKRIAAVKSIASEYGAGEMTAPAIDDVAKSLAAKRGAELTRLTNQKNAVIEGLQGAVSAPKAQQAIVQQVRRLRQINSEAFAPVISRLESFHEQLASGKTLSQIEGNRKLLGDMFADPSLAAIKGDGQKALNAIYGPLRDDMGAFIKANGNPADFNKWKTANDQLSQMAGDLKSTAMKRALRNAETTPEDVASMLFSQKPSDVRRLYSALSPAGRSKAQAAILQRAVEKSGGLESISPDRFATQISNLGKSVGVFFQGDDLARIEGLTRVLKATQRAAQAGLAPPTGVQAVPYVMGAGFTTLFGVPGGIAAAAGTGLLARAYESPPVRNLLLKVARSKEGSREEAVLLKRTSAAIAAATQNANPSSINGLNDNFMRMGAAVASPDQGPDQQQ